MKGLSSGTYQDEEYLAHIEIHQDELMIICSKHMLFFAKPLRFHVELAISLDGNVFSLFRRFANFFADL